MNKGFIILIVALSACTSQVKKDQRENESSKEHENPTTVIQLNNGSKWKADEATKNNVAAILEIVKDSSYALASKRMELIARVQSEIDTLITQCRMKGKEHEALHIWLESVLKDMKVLKGNEDVYIKAQAVLENDIESFYLFFE